MCPELLEGHSSRFDRLTAHNQSGALSRSDDVVPRARRIMCPKPVEGHARFDRLSAHSQSGALSRSDDVVPRARQSGTLSPPNHVP
jgi:hypothetical protein